MNIYLIIYGVLGLFLLLAMAAILAVVSGKSILHDFQRLIQRNGCDVFIANKNRNILHLFKTPKNDSFKINGFVYITNPEKTMNLSPIAKLNVISSIKKTSLQQLGLLF